jgi:hypothetical protein
MAVPPDREADLAALVQANGVPAARLGATGPSAAAPAAGADAAPAARMIAWPGGDFAIDLDELRAASEETLPRHFAR